MSLKYEGYIRYRGDILNEYSQCKSEGKQVDRYRPAIEELCRLDTDTLIGMEEQLKSISALLQSCPTDPAYPYEEPSDYESILASAPAAAKAPSFAQIPKDDRLRHKLAGAWLGRIAGCLLGKPVEGWQRDGLYPLLKASDNFPLHRYIKASEIPADYVEKNGIYIGPGATFADLLPHTAPVDDDTNYTVFAMKLVETYGRGFTPDHVMEGWLRWIPYLTTFTAERVAYRNAAMGFLPPATATYMNPYREYIGAQIRGDFFGYINPGNPAEAARMAFNDASVSHVKNGIYGEMLVSAMIAAAACTDDIREIIETGLAYVPVRSRLAESIREIIDCYESGVEVYEVMERLHRRFNEQSHHDWCYVTPNAMIVVMALLYGEGDFGKSICYAVHACFDTDCNGATVGSILGMRNGEAGIEPRWIAPFEKNLSTSIEGYNQVTVDQLVDKTMALLGETDGTDNATIQYAP